MLSKLLIAIGLRSRCCSAKIEVWHAGKDICAECHQWIRKNSSLAAIKSINHDVAHPVLNLKSIK